MCCKCCCCCCCCCHAAARDSDSDCAMDCAGAAGDGTDCAGDCIVCSRPGQRWPAEVQPAPSGGQGHTPPAGTLLEGGTTYGLTSASVRHRAAPAARFTCSLAASPTYSTSPPSLLRKWCKVGTGGPDMRRTRNGKARCERGEVPAQQTSRSENLETTRPKLRVHY